MARPRSQTPATGLRYQAGHCAATGSTFVNTACTLVQRRKQERCVIARANKVSCVKAVDLPLGAGYTALCFADGLRPAPVACARVSGRTSEHPVLAAENTTPKIISVNALDSTSSRGQQRNLGRALALMSTTSTTNSGCAATQRHVWCIMHVLSESTCPRWSLLVRCTVYSSVTPGEVVERGCLAFPLLGAPCPSHWVNKQNCAQGRQAGERTTCGHHAARKQSRLLSAFVCSDCWHLLLDQRQPDRITDHSYSLVITHADRPVMMRSPLLGSLLTFEIK